MELDYLLRSFILITLIQVVFAVIAVIRKTDKLTDLSYGFTFVINAWFLYFATYQNRPYYDLVITLLVTLWGFRLSLYLFMRILLTGKDKRFDGIREKPLKFIGFWVLQAVSVFVVSLPVTIFLILGPQWQLGAVSFIGLMLWLIGFIFESISDQQKFEFKSDPKNKGKFIQTGLWKYSRHPNYFGELSMWWGLFLFGVGSIGAWWPLSIFGPLFISFLILKVSGIPTLEKKYAEVYKDDAKYQKYKKGTSILIPWFTRS